MPVILSSGRSNTRKAARLAVYEATMIIAKPAHTMPRIRAEKLRGAPAGREERSEQHHEGLAWLPKPCQPHEPSCRCAPSICSASSCARSFCTAQTKKPLQLLPGHVLCRPERVGNPGQGIQAKLPCTVSHHQCWGCRTALTTATNVQHSASPNLLPGCSREGSGNEGPQGPCGRGRLWKGAGAFPLPAQLRAWAAGHSRPSVSCDLPSPMPEFSRTPQENHMAEERVRASSSSSSLFTLNRPNGLEDKTQNPSHSPHPDSQDSPLCPTCPGAALCHSFLQTVPCPKQLLPLPGTSLC